MARIVRIYLGIRKKPLEDVNGELEGLSGIFLSLSLIVEKQAKQHISVVLAFTVAIKVHHNARDFGPLPFLVRAISLSETTTINT